MFQLLNGFAKASVVFHKFSGDLVAAATLLKMQFTRCCNVGASVLRRVSQSPIALQRQLCQKWHCLGDATSVSECHCLLVASVPKMPLPWCCNIAQNTNAFVLQRRSQNAIAVVQQHCANSHSLSLATLLRMPLPRCRIISAKVPCLGVVIALLLQHCPT